MVVEPIPPWFAGSHDSGRLEHILQVKYVKKRSCSSFAVNVDSDERNELDALRLENDTLRRNLGRLEEKVQRAEEHSLAQAQSTQQPTGPEICGPGQSAPLEVHQLHGILQWLDVRGTLLVLSNTY